MGIKLSDSVGAISGVGPTREKQLFRLGICTVRDLIYNFPRLYEERGNIVPLSACTLDTPCSFLLTVGSVVKSVAIRRGMTISKFKAFDDTGAIEIIYFNAPFVKDVFHIGETFRFFGKVTLSKKTLQLTSPKYEPYVEGIPLPHFVPVYSLTQGINSKFIEKITLQALNSAATDIVDPLPEKIRTDMRLPTLSHALRNVHFPEDEKSLATSLKRLAFDELLYFGLAISRSKNTHSTLPGIPLAKCDLKPLLNKLPYELTNSQKSAINDIYSDTVALNMSPKAPMSRILIGDVGSGKTICAISAAYIAARSGYQTAFMAPTEILAQQHYADIKSLLGDLNISCELLIGSISQKEKKRIYAEIESGDCSVVVGTHALLSDKFNFAKLGLIITDEQHRFGINQRAVLKDKTASAHMLVMSATPIPRTLALALYGDLNVSKITDMPKGRQRVDTFVVDEGYRDRLCAFIEKQVAAGGQCYVVCPAIEAADEVADNAFEISSFSDTLRANSISKNVKNAKEHADFLRQKLNNLHVECLHGKMRPAEKESIMNGFKNGEIDVLVSTTVIEVGVNVPNANLMIVENAERFGLAQLHQLRGRVGRGTRKSYCVLVSGTSSETSSARLNIMKSTYDGFEIAEQDLLLRGPGDFFASHSRGDMRQSGGLEFKIASLCDDKTLFEDAFRIAKEIISVDPELNSPENEGLKIESDRYYSASRSTIS